MATIVACDVCGKAGPSNGVATYRVAELKTVKTFEVDLCKEHKIPLLEILAHGRAKEGRSGRNPVVPARQGTRRLR